MRTVSLLSLTLTAAVTLAGCAGEAPTPSGREETAARAPVAPERDLTLQTAPEPALEVASPVELARAAPEPAQPRPAGPQSLPNPRPEKTPAAPEPLEPAPILVPVARSEIRVGPTPEEEAVPGGRELAPGRTVTVIPAASGPSLEADEDDSWLPSERPRGIIGRGGGTCRPRRGVGSIGIGGRIPVGIPARRLR
jgi:hypothetical protein